ncbi:hypothetical protein ACFXKW_27390 [Streptomyces sp. NPDC059193]|uniref:hypothetical protein n=1 Tax=Streptomyces sp. NPDC059193 TaxID=3346763 RepID=UPI00368FFFF8
MNFSRYRRPSVFLLLTVGVVFGAAAVAGLEAGDQGGLVLLLRIREYFFLLVSLALAALIGAVLLWLPEPALRAPRASLLVLAAVTLLFVGFASTVSDRPDREVKAESAPGRGDRQLVVVSRPGFLDPVWCVYVHQGSQPLERRWTAGCFNGDSEDNSLSETLWTAPDRIRMTTAGGEVHEVTLTPGGRPDRVVSVG